MKIEGIITALVTPFDAAGEVDEALRLRGIDCGNPRAPLKAMNAKEAGTLKEQLEKLGIL